MHRRTSRFVTAGLSGAIALALAAIAGCQGSGVKSDASVNSVDAASGTVAASGAATRPVGEPEPGQEQFDSDDQAAAAIVAAAKARDHDAINRMFGPSANEFVSGDKVEDERAFDHFVKHAGEHLELEKKDAKTSFIDIGQDKWPFPIPLTRLDNGKWFFDSEAGKQEIRCRRIGGNELETIKVCRAFVEAEREYASADRDGSGVLKYAQHITSRHGKDGLYWEAGPGEEESPFGPLIAMANMEGYAAGIKDGHKPQPFHGYIYKVLTRQGAAAPGGAYDYVINSNMIAGFALVACPIEYGTSGVMTFTISHQGKLYQKDLGPNTSEIVRSMKEYNPDDSWTLVTD